MQRKEKTYHKRNTERIVSIICCTLAALLILVLLTLCVIYHDQISVAMITSVLPSHKAAAIIVILLLFGIKSLSVVFPCAVLYATSGIVFPRLTALLVNMLGTVLMTSLPFWVARLSGAQHIEKIINQHPKMALLQDKQTENSLFFAFIVRIVGIFPCDLVSAYFGITQMPYGKYILGTMVGFIPTICIFTVMGMSAHDMSSPAFILSVCLECAIAISSCVIYRILKKKQINVQGESEC